jgi:hypothetical protein
VNVLYLCANVPAKDVEYVAKVKKPDILYTHLTSVTPNFNFEKFITKISSRIPIAPLIVSGQLSQQYRKRLPENVLLKRSLQEVLEYVSAIDVY